MTPAVSGQYSGTGDGTAVHQKCRTPVRQAAWEKPTVAVPEPPSPLTSAHVVHGVMLHILELWVAEKYAKTYVVTFPDGQMARLKRTVVLHGEASDAEFPYEELAQLVDGWKEQWARKRAEIDQLYKIAFPPLTVE